MANGILSYHQDWQWGPQAGSDEMTGPANQVYAKFSSPWKSLGTYTGSTEIRKSFDFAKFLWLNDSTFQQALRRVVSYFLTNIEYFDPTHSGELTDDDINSYREVIEDQLDTLSTLKSVLENLSVYGNVLVSMLPPIKRKLTCPHCHLVQPVENVMSKDNPGCKFKYNPKKVTFEVTCPVCTRRSPWIISDTKADYRRNIKFQIWNPYEFIVEYNPFTDQRQYTWEIPGHIKRMINDSDAMMLASAPLVVLQAVGEGKNCVFNDGIILHLREQDIAGIYYGGWGIPQALYTYSASRYVFSLRRMNEVLAEDYMIPCRVMSPEHAADPNNAYDAGSTMDLADWNQQMQNIWALQRKDPGSVHTVGFPIKYQVLGGEGKSLVPGELLVNAEDRQLNARGIPPEFYRGSMSLQTAPMAARLFESHWQHIPRAAAVLLKWAVRNCSDELGWKPFGARLESPKIADNMDQLMLFMQLMQMGKASDTTIMQRVGLDNAEEARRKKDDAVMQATMENEMQKEMDKLMAGQNVLSNTVAQDAAAQQQAAAGAGGGAMPPGGAAPGGLPPADPVADIMARIKQFGNPQTPTTATQMLDLATEAAALFINLPEVQKRQALRDVDAQNPVMGDFIRKQMEKQHKEQNSQFIAQGQAAMQQGAM